MAAGRRAAAMTPLAWLAAAHQGGGGSVAGRIALVAVAVLAVGAFAVLQIKARSHRQRPPSEPRRRRYNSSDWRTLPLSYWPEGRDDEGPLGNGHGHRPDWRYGYPPGYEPYPLYDPARSPWATRDDVARDPRSLSGTGQRARRPSKVRLCVPKVFVSVTGKRVDWRQLVALPANTVCG
jgi:hypothetical protein